MEEVLLRFPHIGEGIYKKLNGKDFCKSMEVTRSWNYFIRNQRVLQRAYNTHKAPWVIQTLTEEIDWYQSHQQKKTPFHLAAQRGYFAVCQELMENSNDKNSKDKNPHFIMQLRKVTCHFVSSLLQMVMTKIPKMTVEGLHFMMLL